MDKNVNEFMLKKIHQMEISQLLNESSLIQTSMS